MRQLRFLSWHLQQPYWAVLASGLLLGLSAPGMGLWPLAWIGMVPVLWALVHTTGLKTAWWQGLFWGCIYNGILLFWFWGLHPLTWMGFSDILSLIITGAAWGVATITQGFIISVIWAVLYLLGRGHAARLVVAAPILWTVGLWLLNQHPLGLPWGFLAYSQAGVPWIRQSAYGLTFWGLEALIVLANALLLLALLNRSLKRILPVGAIFLGIWLVGRLIQPPPSVVLRTFKPIAIQGNLSIEAERLFLTWEKKHRYYHKLVNAAVSLPNQDTQLLLLPEGAILLPEDRQIRLFPIPKHAALLSGGILRTPQGAYNGAFLLQAERPQQFVGKRILVPFGETTPFVSEEWLQRFLGQFGIAYGRGFAKGLWTQPPLTLDDFHIGPLICFEALYPNLVQGYRKQSVDLLVTFSNLGWYHRSLFLEEQFLAINQLRAAEAGVPLILVTNTGTSAFIDEHGHVLTQSASGMVQFLTPDKALSPSRTE